MDTKRALAQLNKLAMQRRALDDLMNDHVAVLRAADMDGHCEASWQEIGDALGITRQAAQQKFARRGL